MRSWCSVRISCARCSAGNSTNCGSKGKSFSEGFASPLCLMSFCLRFIDLRLIVKAAPIAQITTNVKQPTTKSAILPWLRWCDREGEMIELEELDVIGPVELEEPFDLASKRSFTAEDVHDEGYWLPLKAMRNIFRTEVNVDTLTLHYNTFG